MHSFYMPVTHWMVSGRTGPFKSHDFTCLFKNKNMKGALIWNKFWPAAMTSNYLWGVNSRTCRSRLIRDVKYFGILWKVIQKRQQIFVFSLRYWVRSSYIHWGYLIISNGATGFPMLPRGAVNSWFSFRRWHESPSLTNLLPISAFRANRDLERVNRRCVSLRVGCVKGIMILSYHVLN